MSLCFYVFGNLPARREMLSTHNFGHESEKPKIKSAFIREIRVPIYQLAQNSILV
jgi:hypothetical protein